MEQVYAILLSLVIVTLGVAVPSAAEDGTYSCTVTIGLGNPVLGPAVTVRVTEDVGVTLGGCEIVTLSEASIVESFEAAEGCHIAVDTDDDGISDASAAEGEEYPPGASITAFCDAGVADVVNSVTLSPAA